MPPCRRARDWGDPGLAAENSTRRVPSPYIARAPSSRRHPGCCLPGARPQPAPNGPALIPPLRCTGVVRTIHAVPMLASPSRWPSSSRSPHARPHWGQASPTSSSLRRRRGSATSQGVVDRFASRCGVRHPGGGGRYQGRSLAPHEALICGFASTASRLRARALRCRRAAKYLLRCNAAVTPSGRDRSPHEQVTRAIAAVSRTGPCVGQMCATSLVRASQHSDASVLDGVHWSSPLPVLIPQGSILGGFASIGRATSSGEPPVVPGRPARPSRRSA